VRAGGDCERQDLTDRVTGQGSRKAFLTAAVATVALGVTAGCQDDDEGPAVDEEHSDLEILRFALRLERVEAAFYEAVIASGALEGSLLELARTFHEQEREHVEAVEELVRRLGGRPEAGFPTDFPIEDEGQVLELARRLEDLGADAYLGQLARLRHEPVIDKVVSIYAVEARHVGALNELAGEGRYTPAGPFAKPLGMRQAREQLDPFIG